MRHETELIAFADFEALRRGVGEEQAVGLLHSLLLDEMACPLRIRWLRELIRRSLARFPDLAGRARPPFLERVLGAVDAPGTIAAWRAGTVTFAELATLTRAPRALYEAHCRLLDIQPEFWPGPEGDLVAALEGDDTEGSPPAPASAPPKADASGATRPGQPTGLSSMQSLLGRQEYERFRRRLERFPLLPELLAAIELDPGLDQDLLQFIQDQCPLSQPNTDPIEALSGWLQSFAAARALPARVPPGPKQVRLDRPPRYRKANAGGGEDRQTVSGRLPRGRAPKS